MVNNSTKINKTNSHLSPQIIFKTHIHKKNRHMALEF